MILRRRQLLLLSLVAPVGAGVHARATGPAIALATLWGDHLEPANYLVSEKYDGVRGVWDGKALRFRSGRVVPAPTWFTARLPRVALDGELWLARGRFDALSGIVRKARPLDAEWRDVRYMAFELPGADGSFAERAQRLREIAGQTAWASFVAVDQRTVADRAALKRRLAATVALGGEGLVLHRADAPYQAGRTDAVMKLKPEMDAEAVVVAHRAGQGRYAGQLGALEVRAPDGRRFLIGTGFSDAQRRDPPAIGSAVTYRYRDLTPSGIPRFASFLRVHDAL